MLRDILVEKLVLTSDSALCEVSGDCPEFFFIT